MYQDVQPQICNSCTCVSVCVPKVELTLQLNLHNDYSIVRTEWFERGRGTEGFYQNLLDAQCERNPNNDKNIDLILCCKAHSCVHKLTPTHSKIYIHFFFNKITITIYGQKLGHWLTEIQIFFYLEKRITSE